MYDVEEMEKWCCLMDLYGLSCDSLPFWESVCLVSSPCDCSSCLIITNELCVMVDLFSFNYKVVWIFRYWKIKNIQQ